MMDNKKKLKFGLYNCKHFGVDKYVMQTLLVACDFFGYKTIVCIRHNLYKD